MGMMRGASAALWHLVWLRGEPDPRVLQLGFTVLLARRGRAARRRRCPARHPNEWVPKAIALAALLTARRLVLVPASRQRASITVIATLDIGIVGHRAASAARTAVSVCSSCSRPSGSGRRYGEWGALRRRSRPACVLITLPGAGPSTDRPGGASPISR